MNKIWLETLAECCRCYPDKQGNMPCDNGRLCDACEQEWVQEVYQQKKRKDAAAKTE
ncbi:MAG TPA: hypothetical protein VFC74_06955 [Oscillospiraceae bacterium]|nr:hypothetical protein [Oscillospiraceae bacterium]